MLKETYRYTGNDFELIDAGRSSMELSRQAQPGAPRAKASQRYDKCSQILEAIWCAFREKRSLEIECPQINGAIWCSSCEKRSVDTECLSCAALDETCHIKVNTAYVAPEFVRVRAGRITDRERQQRAFAEQKREVESLSQRVRELNTALNVLKRKSEQETRRIAERTLSSIKDYALPQLDKLKASGLSPSQKKHLKDLETFLLAAIPASNGSLAAYYLKLTPRELPVARLVKQGLSTKEISELLRLSPKTIDTHRARIRRKLGLVNGSETLRSALLRMD
ncbi:response regulator transcription factor [Thermodesulfobacteriota bacterium]